MEKKAQEQQQMIEGRDKKALFGAAKVFCFPLLSPLDPVAVGFVRQRSLPVFRCNIRTSVWNGGSQLPLPLPLPLPLLLVPLSVARLASAQEQVTVSGSPSQGSPSRLASAQEQVTVSGSPSQGTVSPSRLARLASAQEQVTVSGSPSQGTVSPSRLVRLASAQEQVNVALRLASVQPLWTDSVLLG